jgi:hypothetical protein
MVTLRDPSASETDIRNDCSASQAPRDEIEQPIDTTDIVEDLPEQVSWQPRARVGVSPQLRPHISQVYDADNETVYDSESDNSGDDEQDYETVWGLNENLDETLENILRSYTYYDSSPSPSDQLERLLSEAFGTNHDHVVQPLGLQSTGHQPRNADGLGANVATLDILDMYDDNGSEPDIEVQYASYEREIMESIPLAEETEQPTRLEAFVNAIGAVTHDLREWFTTRTDRAESGAIVRALTPAQVQNVPPPAYTKHDPNVSETQTLSQIYEKWQAQGRPQLGLWALRALEMEEARKCEERLPIYSEVDPLRALPKYRGEMVDVSTQTD